MEVNLYEETIRALTDPRIAIIVMSLCIAGLVTFFLTLYYYEREKAQWKREKEKLLEQLEKKRGFTLVEMLTVLAIIAVLSAILIPVTRTLQQNLYKHTCITNMQKIYHALRMYYLDTGTYPANKITLSDGREVDLGLLSLHSPELVGLVMAGLENQPVDPQVAKSIIARKGIYPIFSTELHCPANHQHPRPLLESGGSYYIDPLYFNYAVVDPWLGHSPYQRVRCDRPEKRPIGVECTCLPPLKAYSSEAFRKQLYAKEALSSTVVTWCWAHDGKNIVLFLDGHTEVRAANELLIPAVDGGIAPWAIQPRRR